MDNLKNKPIENAVLEEITWYELRHSHYSTMINSGFSVYEITDRQGASVNNTSNTSAHLSQSRKVEMSICYYNLLKNKF